MPVIIGQLDVIAAPPPKVGAPPDQPVTGPTADDLARLMDSVEARRRRRVAD